MPLNPQVEALLAMFAAMPAWDYSTLTAPALRAVNDNPMAFGAPPAVARAEDLTLDLPGRSLPARLYVPEGAASPAPLVVFYHGGGWVIGTLETHDATCRALAEERAEWMMSFRTRMLAEMGG